MFIFAILILIPALTFAEDPLLELEHTLFGKLDADRDGKISKREIEVLFLSFDTDHDTLVSKAEFTVAVDKLDAGFDGHESALFDLIDRDADGHMDKADVDAVFTLADFSGDHSIDQHEFHVIFQAVISHAG